jgi:hypothetical protein
LNHIGSVLFYACMWFQHQSHVKLQFLKDLVEGWENKEKTPKSHKNPHTPKPVCDLAPTGAASSVGKPFQIVLRSNGNPWHQNLESSEISQYIRIMRFWDHFPPLGHASGITHPEKGVCCFYLCCCSKQPWKQTPLHSSNNHENTQLDPYMYKCAFFYPYSNRHKRAAEEKVMTPNSICIKTCDLPDVFLSAV